MIKYLIARVFSLSKNAAFLKYFFSAGWLVLDKIFRLLANVFVNIWLARHLGSNDFGLFSYCQSFIGLFIVISTLGLDNIVIKELVNNKKKSDVLLGTTFLLKILGSILFIITSLTIANFIINDSYTKFLILIIASSIFFHSFNVINLYFQSKVLNKYIAHVNIISLFIASILKVILIVFEANLTYFVSIIFLENLLLAVGLLLYYRKSGLSIKKWNYSKNTASNLLKDSWPLILNGIFISIFMRIDQIMIRELLGYNAVGQYAAAVRLSEVWYSLPTIAASTLFPAIIKAKNQNVKSYYFKLQNFYTLLVWAALVIAMVTTATSEWVVNLLYGKEYLKSASVLTIHIWSGVFVFFGCAWSRWMVVENLQSTMFKIQLLSAICNVILNFYLIDIYGIVGAAISTLISYGMGHTIFALFFKNQKIAVIMLWKSFNITKIKNGI